MKYEHEHIMDDLSAYKVARDEAKDMADKTNQDGTPVFGFQDIGYGYEITADSPENLYDYNIDFSIYAPDSQDFNLIVRKENPKALHKMPKNKLREILTRIVDSV